MTSCNNPKCKHKIAAINIKTGLCEFCHAEYLKVINDAIDVFAYDNTDTREQMIELYNKLKIV